MNRRAGMLQERVFDVLVIGGGIYGAWTAYDAALRGLDVALVEQGDWASGTSSASSKLIHGGLRYLERMQLPLVRKSLTERRRLLQLGPHRVTPLRFLVPLYDDDRIGPARMRIGLWLYDRLAGRNDPIPRSQRLGREGVLRACPFIAADGLQAGFSYGDALTDDARYTLEIVAGAMDAGAVCVSYVRAGRLLYHKGRAVGARAFDVVADGPFDIHARIVVDTTGPWVAAREAEGDVRLIKGVHLALPSLPTKDAMLLTARSDGRVFFVIPWYGCTLLGTTDSDFEGDPARASVDDSDVEYLLTAARDALGGIELDKSAVQGQFVGLRALRDEPDKPPAAVSREWMLDEPSPGLLVSIGGKLTSARADAAVIVDRALAAMGRPHGGKTPTETLPLPWSPGLDFDFWAGGMMRRARELGFDPETASFIPYRFGRTTERLLQIAHDQPELAERLDPKLPFAKAEVIHCAEAEGVVRLQDLLRRRIPLLILTSPTLETVREAAELAAPSLGWDERRVNDEVRSVAMGPLQVSL